MLIIRVPQNPGAVLVPVFRKFPLCFIDRHIKVFRQALYICLGCWNMCVRTTIRDAL